MATNDIQLKNGNGDLLMPKTRISKITNGKMIYDDNGFAVSSSAKSNYYIRKIPLEQGKTYEITVTLDSAKSYQLEFYLANKYSAGSGTVRTLVGKIPVGQTEATFVYTCSDSSRVYPSTYFATATSATLSIVANEIVDYVDTVDDSSYIIEDVIVNASDGTLISGKKVLSSTNGFWQADNNRKYIAIDVKNCETITFTSLADRATAIFFVYGELSSTVGTPANLCKGYYEGQTTVAQAGETVVVDVPKTASYVIIYQYYNTTLFFPQKIVLHKKVKVTDVSSQLDAFKNGVDSVVKKSEFSDFSFNIVSDKWAAPSSVTKSLIMPLENAVYRLDAVDGNCIFAVLQSVDNISVGGTPDYAPGYNTRFLIYRENSKEIAGKTGWYLFVRADNSTTPTDALFPKITKSAFDLSRLYNLNRPVDTIIVAASDSSEQDKKRADFVCGGLYSDKRVIEHAMANITGNKGTIYLCRGTYTIDAFTESHGKHIGIVLPLNKQINIEGYHWGGEIFQDTKIVLPQSTYDSLTDGANYSVICHEYGSSGYNLNSHLCLKHLQFEIYSNQKNITVIDSSWSGQVTIQDVKGTVTTQPGIWGAGDDGLDPVPIENCIFYRGMFGSNHALSRISECGCTGYGIGWAMQGEHLYVESVGAVNCLYGFAFNKFPRIGTQMYVHSMEFHNLLEEGCLNYPYFGENILKQVVNIYGYHNEIRPKFFNQGGHYATEAVAGSWYGHLDYGIQFFPDSHSHGNEPHAVDQKFWADGNGINMQSVNSAQKQIVTTTERISYAPNYGQIVFDKTLNKMLMCVDPQNKSWVDADGVDVDA